MFTEFFKFDLGETMKSNVMQRCCQKAAKTLVLVSGLISLQSLAALREDQQTYERLLTEVNSQLGMVSQQRSCPGVSLTLTCGNGRCEPERGENETTCPLDCLNAPIQSYNAQTFCSAVKKVYAPSTQDEVVSIVRDAISAGNHVRAIGHAHTGNQLICNDGVEVSTENLNHILGIEILGGSEVVTVEPGVHLSTLANWLDQKGKSLGYRLIQFRGVTIAGVLATGSHGSSAKHPSVMAGAIESVTWIGADGEKHESSATNTDPETFGALRTNLGMMGIVVQVKLRIQNQFKLEMNLSYQSDSKLFENNGIINQVSSCDFGQLLWFPHSKKFIQVCGTETQLPADRGAQNVMLDPPVPEFVVKPYQLVMHYGACYSGLSCLLEDLRYATLKILPPFKKTVLGVPEYVMHLVGWSHQVMTSELSTKESAVHEKDLEIAVPLSQAQNALSFMAQRLESNHSCLPLLGVFIRFVISEDATLIAHTVAQGDFKKGEPAVLFEMPQFLPVGLTPQLEEAYQRQYSEVAGGLIKNFKGRAHWGKNDSSIFELQKSLGRYGDRVERFKSVLQKADPHGVFSNLFLNYL